MGSKTKIEWTASEDGIEGSSWNTVRGCERFSPGCELCYAEHLSGRFSGPGQPYEGAARMVDGDGRWTREPVFIEKALKQPESWRAPRRIFVSSMSDLWWDKVPESWIGRVFEIMRKCKQHTFIVLTKRAERMKHVVSRIQPEPLPNLWIGVSVEDQRRAEERIPHLLETPAAVRWLSVEPLIDEVSLAPWLPAGALSWIIIGGESSQGTREARPMKLEWARKIVEECRAFHTPVFVKQLGSVWAKSIKSDHHKGGHFEEFPEDLRIRESPIAPKLADTAAQLPLAL